VAVVVKGNYSDVANDDVLRATSESQSVAEPTTVNLPDTEHFSYYTVADRDSRVLVKLNYWIQAFLFKLVPCVLLTVLTVMLIMVMHQANRRRMALKSQVSCHHVLYYEVGKHNLLRVWDEVGAIYAFKSSTEYLNAVMYMYQVYKASSALGE